ncbi:MAG: hypothetical protein J3K34DRAFT_161581 [Monoraphidium minutum]|nr:MAG: hypothetical protein J3K34DRAFT_161581 [Monoraphidium minutum]
MQCLPGSRVRGPCPLARGGRPCGVRPTSVCPSTAVPAAAPFCSTAGACSSGGLLQQAARRRGAAAASAAAGDAAAGAAAAAGARRPTVPAPKRPRAGPCQAGARGPLPAAAVALLLVLVAPAAAWPEYRAPGPGDSRGPCPAVNALANHGYINRNGRNITLPEIAAAAKKVFNAEPAASFAIGGAVVVAGRTPGALIPGGLFPGPVPGKPLARTGASLLSFSKLADIFLEGRAFFPASFVRDDSAASQPQPSVPNPARVNITLAFAEQTGGYLTAESCARARPAVLNFSRASNPSLTLPALATLVHAGDCVLSLAVFGDGSRVRADHLRSFWAEERIPEDWAPRKVPATLAELLVRLPKQITLNKAQPGCSQGC